MEMDVCIMWDGKVGFTVSLNKAFLKVHKRENFFGSDFEFYIFL